MEGLTENVLSNVDISNLIPLSELPESTKKLGKGQFVHTNGISHFEINTFYSDALGGSHSLPSPAPSLPSHPTHVGGGGFYDPLGGYHSLPSRG